MRIAVKAMIANMVMNVAFVVPMVMLDYEAPHVGLALATSASAYMNALLLYLKLRQEGVYRPQAGWLTYGLKLTLANALLAGSLIALTPILDIWSQWPLVNRVSYLLGIIGIGLAVYLFSLLLSGLRPRHLHR